MVRILLRDKNIPCVTHEIKNKPYRTIWIIEQVPLFFVILATNKAELREVLSAHANLQVAC